MDMRVENIGEEIRQVYKVDQEKDKVIRLI